MNTDLRSVESTSGENRALRLLHQEWYRPEEAAYLLGIDVNTIYQAAFHHLLRAEIVGHDVVSIQRDDLINWIESGHSYFTNPV